MSKFFVSPYDEEALDKQLKMQRKFQWDLEKSIQWDKGVDLNKPLVPLDEKAFFFPHVVSSEERLVISQMMGLVISMSICEMEECLMRLKQKAWDGVLKKKFPVSPEFYALGEEFYIEEDKHSKAFRRYLDRFVSAMGLDLDEIKEYLPEIENTKTEKLLYKETEYTGAAFWWVVTHVEQEFLLMYKDLTSQKAKLDPLYYELHRRHFEEEARHAVFPYLVLNVLIDRQKSPLSKLKLKMSLPMAQMLQVFWAGSSLKRMQKLKKRNVSHPFLKALQKAGAGFENSPESLWRFLTSVPYISPLVNPNFHPKMKEMAENLNVWNLPFPDPDHPELVDY